MQAEGLGIGGVLINIEFNFELQILNSLAQNLRFCSNIQHFYQILCLRTTVEDC